MANSFDKGTLVRITATFTNSSGTAVDPTTVTVKVKDPAATVNTYTTGTTPAVVKDSTGNYHIDIDTTTGVAGKWFYEFLGTGTNQGADEDYFTLNASQF